MLAVLCSCGRGSTTASLQAGDTVRLKYARRLTIVKHDGYTVVSLADPWHKGKTLHTYVLVSTDGQPDGKRTETDEDRLTASLSACTSAPTTLVHVPLKRAVVTTSVHCGLISSLGKGSAIRGVCDLRYINLPWIQQRYRQGLVADCGNGITPTLETIISIDADAVIISPFQNSGGYGRLDEWGRPIIEAADYMETSALGRAEWMKFYGMLFGAEEQADSIFTSVEKEYNRLKETAERSNTRNSIIIDKVSGPVWYVPGGQSTIGRIIADAKADYPFADNDDSGGKALTFETVLAKAADADVWMFRYNSKLPASYASLLSENQGYSRFKAFKTKSVYGCNTAQNTFYEDTPFRPDLLLRDFIIITHPDLKELGSPRYFTKLK